MEEASAKARLFHFRCVWRARTVKTSDPSCF